MSEDGSKTTDQVVELNVGGVYYTTTLTTLTKNRPDALLARMFDSSTSLVRDTKGRCFVDRDGVLFRYVLDFLRNGRLVLPEAFQETERLRQEAEFFRLPDMLKYIVAGGRGGRASAGGGPDVMLTAPDGNDSIDEGLRTLQLQGGSGSGGGGSDVREPGYIVVGYRGTFQFGRDGLADVKFRKLARILVSGRVSICR